MKGRLFGSKSSVKIMVKRMEGGVPVRKLGWRMFGTLKVKGIQTSRVYRDLKDRVIWTASRYRTFSFKSLYSILEIGNPLSFPSDSIWRSSALLKVAFFAWEASWGKVLTLDQLQMRGFFLANRCFFCLSEA
ncbi:hypothetical protein AAG906_003045 [Vitis piasezkii]